MLLTQWKQSLQCPSMSKAMSKVMNVQELSFAYLSAKDPSEHNTSTYDSAPLE
jgi:hypothetical protein